MVLNRGPLDFESSACGQACPNQLVCHFLQNFKKEVSDEVEFLYIDKHESLLHIDTTVLIGMVKHSQSPQIASSNVFTNSQERN